ncbi:MAG: hypothetical protein Q8P10_00800 [bacterium]|nr:hypothetical protein [bacterium]
MNDLTQRQVEILKSLIEEYIESAEPVGSETLEKKHNLTVSPATIRNEMVTLTKFGYIQKTHTSSGRVPTPVGMKFYVKQLMKEKELSVAEEVAVKEKLWDYREKEPVFMKELTKSLAEKTGVLALAVMDDGEIYSSGYAKILDMPEFFDIDITRSLLSVIEEFDYFNNLFSKLTEDAEVHFLLGDDLPKLPAYYGCVYSKFETPGNGVGEIGVIGPLRLNYTSIVPVLKCYKNLINEIAKGW